MTKHGKPYVPTETEDRGGALAGARRRSGGAERFGRTVEAGGAGAVEGRRRMDQRRIQGRMGDENGLRKDRLRAVAQGVAAIERRLARPVATVHVADMSRLGYGRLARVSMMSGVVCRMTRGYRVLACGQGDPATLGRPVGSAPTGVGHSLVVSPFGEVLGRLGAAAGTLVVDLDLAEVDRARTTIPVLANRRPIG